jgi:hypothetical protein
VADQARLRELIFGVRTTHVLHVAVTLGLPTLLTERPRSAEELAEAAHADPGALYRLLRVLGVLGLVEERDGIFALTELGADLESVQAAATFAGRTYHLRAWEELLHSVRTGETAFDHLHGRSVWEYRADHPEESTIFDDWMTENTRGFDDAIVAGYDFGRFAHVVDVGGGQGALLTAILRANPGIRGTLFDQPHVVPREGSFEIVGGSFFDAVPPGADAYVLKWIVHDWDDERAVEILRNCARAMPEDARVLLIERELSDPAAVWTDLTMLVMVGGRERTEAEYASLFEAAGLEPLEATRVGAGHAVFEARQGAAMSPSR